MKPRLASLGPLLVVLLSMVLLSCNNLFQSSSPVKFRLVINAAQKRDGINCLAVNVIGSGIPAANPNRDTSLLPAALNGNLCTYPGATASLMRESTTIAER